MQCTAINRPKIQSTLRFFKIGKFLDKHSFSKTRYLVSDNFCFLYFRFMVPCIILYSTNNQQIQLYAVNFIPLLGSLYMFRVFYTPIIRSTIFNTVSIQEEIKSRLKLGNACYYLVQNLFSSRLLSKNLKIKMYRTIILPVVLYGCET